jgi:hypothetical protein
MPVVLIGIILLAFCIDGLIPMELKSILYALSLSIKSTIIFLLPLIIFMLLFKTLAQLAGNATKIVFFILIAATCSNLISTMLSYQIGSRIYDLDLSLTIPKDLLGLAPTWTFKLPTLIANDHAMFAGLILGLVCSQFIPNTARRVSTFFDIVVNFCLKGIYFAIPVFVAGFVVKLIHDKVLESILYDYAVVFAIVTLSLGGYLCFIYALSANFKLSQFLGNLRNMIPPAIAGFGSMSSAATMPLTILATEKNTNNPSLTRLVIPSTVNIHLIGDCFSIPIFAFAVMKNFGMPEPAFTAYFIFALYFVLAKFSVAAIPGGGILVMLPLLESHFGFTAEMASLITALYILFDPVITCANVCGNGGFAMMINKLKHYFLKDIPQENLAEASI